MKLVALAILLGITLVDISFAAPLQPTNLIVRVGQEKKQRGTRIRVKFVALVEDSRCPADVQCIWAGNAKIKLRLTKNGRSEVVELNTSGPESSVQFEGYEFRLAGVSPTPRSNARIDRNGYVAALEIKKL